MTDERLQHRSFWDCYELETYELVATIHPGQKSSADEIEVYECSECGTLFGCELFPEHHDPEFNHFGYKDSATLESITDGYGDVDYE